MGDADRVIKEMKMQVDEKTNTIQMLRGQIDQLIAQLNQQQDMGNNQSAEFK